MNYKTESHEISNYRFPIVLQTNTVETNARDQKQYVAGERLEVASICVCLKVAKIV